MNTTTTEPYVTLEQAAKHFHVSVSTFRNWVQKGVIPKDAYVRLGSIYRYKLSEVEKALQSQSEQKGDDE